MAMRSCEGVTSQRGQELLKNGSREHCWDHNQATTGEDTKDLASVVVRSRVRELARELILPVVMSYEYSINTITNTNPVYNHKRVKICRKIVGVLGFFSQRYSF